MFKHFVLSLLILWCINAEKCKLKEGFLDGECKLFENCPKDRKYDDTNPKCGSGSFPDVCCESHPEDFIDKPYGRIARKECQKYMDTLFNWVNFGLVFGGINAQAKEYTFMAALGYGPSTKDIKYHCGGSLISDRHVLTAGHCLFSREDGPVRYVVLGDLDLNRTDDMAEPQGYYVINATAHPQFKPPSSYNDIAILELDRPVNFTEYVKPACLDFGQWPIDNETSLIATGWGYIDTEGNRASHLQEVGLVEYGFEQCSASYAVDRRRLALGLQNTQLCAGGKVEKKDTCQGDSGGPLSRLNVGLRYEQYKGYIIVGVTSFGKLCGFTHTPGVYTKVYSFIPWIESVVWPEEFLKEQERLENMKVELVGSQQQSIQTQQQQQQFQMGHQTIPQSGTQTQMPQEEFLTDEQRHEQDRIEDHFMNKHQNSEDHVVGTTRKPVPFVDVHYFSDK